METPEDVAAIVRLHEAGWGSKRIARELGVARNTVRRYVRAGGYVPYRQPDRPKQLDDVTDWLRETFLRHRGNAAVVQQELVRVHGVEVTLRTVQRAVAPYRQELEAAARATVRFETRPGRQLQVDFGVGAVAIGGERQRVHFCVLTLGYSRRVYVAAWPCERQSQWLASIEGAFRHFGGLPEELLTDNARALVSRHDVETREVVFNDIFRAFCAYWGVRPRACAPYRAQTKGKDERMVQYVRRNALAGHEFASWEAMHAHLQWWMRDVADVRVHGTLGERPIDRFERDEQRALKVLPERPAFESRRELTRKVPADQFVDVDTNRYSVPWRFIGRRVLVVVAHGRVEVHAGGEVVASHPLATGGRQLVRDTRHFEGIARPSEVPPVNSSLARSLDAYAAAAGGAW